jgi:2-pyrone-4,6-dicarboxylate lactonase
MDDVAPYLRGLDLPIMVEAMGHPDPGEPAVSPGFQALLGLAQEKIVSVKLSHPYHIDRSGLPYPTARTLAHMLVAAAPDQLVWGSDWPHPMRENRMPNDGDLIDLLPDWAGSVEGANAVLVDNARRFYEGA